MATPTALKPLADAMQATSEPEASDHLLIKAQSLNIHPFVPKRKTGKYDDQVQTLIEVDEKTGYQNSIEILVPEPEIKKHKKWFSDSARAYDKSARIVNGDTGVPQGDGGVILEFVLTPKVIRTTKPKETVPTNDTTTEA